MADRRSNCCTDAGAPQATLAPPARRLFELIQAFAATNALAPPDILSACRTADAQRNMQRQWDIGNRGGLRVRPADPENSAHVADEVGLCWAFDLWPQFGKSSPWLEILGRYVGSRAIQIAIPGATWGGSWLPKDETHFQVNPMRLAAEIRLI